MIMFISFIILTAYFILHLDKVYYKEPRWQLILSCLIVLLVSYWVPGFTLLALFTHEAGRLGQYCYAHRDVAVHWLTSSRVSYRGHCFSIPKGYKYVVHSYALDKVLAYKELPVWSDYNGDWEGSESPLVVSELTCNYRSASKDSLMEINK